jgi:SAM-dependent methyltransferase
MGEDAVNEGHLQGLASDRWARFLQDELLPWALDDVDLGANVLEVGPGPGRTTDLLRERCERLTAVEVDESLADALATRTRGTNVEVRCADGAELPFDDGTFSGACCFVMLHHVPTSDHQDRLLREVGRVLAGGAWFVGADGIASDDLASRHVDDTYNPVDPASLSERLTAAGFGSVRVQERNGMYAFAACRDGATAG